MMLFTSLSVFACTNYRLLTFAVCEAGCSIRFIVMTEQKTQRKSQGMEKLGSLCRRNSPYSDTASIL